MLWRINGIVWICAGLYTRFIHNPDYEFYVAMGLCMACYAVAALEDIIVELRKDGL